MSVLSCNNILKGFLTLVSIINSLKYVFACFLKKIYVLEKTQELEIMLMKRIVFLLRDHARDFSGE
jgi:hypothetical protein